MAYSKTATSVIQGMSQQADKYMVDGQCRYQKNFMPSPVDGISKRASTELVAIYSFLDVNEDYKFFNVEVSGKNYQFILSINTLFIVEDFALKDTIVINPDLQDYIGTNLDLIKLFYINDKVYILNTGVTVETLSEEVIDHSISGAIWAVGVAQYKTYSATVTVKAVSDNSVAYTDSASILVDTAANTKTSVVIDALFSGLSGSTWFDTARTDEVIVCRLKNEHLKDYYIEIITNDDSSNTYLKSFDSVVSSSNNLPRFAYEGMKATVSTTEGNIEDWYLRFEANEQSAVFSGETVRVQGKDTLDGSLHWESIYIDTDSTTVFMFDPIRYSRHTSTAEVTAVESNFYDLTWETVPNNPALEGQPVNIGDIVSSGVGGPSYIRATRRTFDIKPSKGTWKETAKEGINNFNNKTLPLVVNLIDGTWTIQQDSWLPRRVGDVDSAPFPKFVGRTINSIYEHAGRIIIVTDDYVDLSTVEEGFNWFRYTATEILITDPFPVSYGNKKGNLRYPVTLNGDLYIFGDRDQLILSGQPLSPTNYSLTGVSSYPIENIEPIVTGDQVHFVSKSGKFNTVYTYGVKANTTNVLFAESISDQISRHITGNVIDMFSDYNLHTMFIRTDEDLSKIYMYNFYSIRGELRQSAWSDIEFSFDILNMYIANNMFYILGRYNNGIQMYKFDTKDLLTLDKPYLDCMQEVTFINGVANVDLISNEFRLYDWQNRPGTELPYIDNTNGTITCNLLANYPTYKCYIGIPYECVYVPRLVTEVTNTGSVNHTAKYKLTSLGLDLGLSGQYNVKINGNGADYNNNYNLSPIPKTNVGYSGSHKYTQDISVRALADNNLTITISAKNAEPLCIEGMYYLYGRNQRRTAL